MRRDSERGGARQKHFTYNKISSFKAFQALLGTLNSGQTTVPTLAIWSHNVAGRRKGMRVYWFPFRWSSLYCWISPKPALAQHTPTFCSGRAVLLGLGVLPHAASTSWSPMCLPQPNLKPSFHRLRVGGGGRNTPPHSTLSSLPLGQQVAADSSSGSSGPLRTGPKPVHWTALPGGHNSTLS